MDRWRDSSRAKLDEEFLITTVDRTRLYDKDHRTQFDDGSTELTTHRLIWRKDERALSLPLSIIKSTHFEDGSFLRSEKLVIVLADQGGRGGEDITKVGGKQGIKELHGHIQVAIREEKWNVRQVKRPAKKEIRSGISGIEKKLQQKSANDNQNISKAFQDLDRLMDMAKPMVALAKNISTKIRDKQGGISEDETVQFKSYLLSLGIDDPVTKDSAGSDKKYYQGLAKEMFLVLDQPIQVAGGMMTLTDAFVRVNRARGLELVSPEDVLNAAKQLKETNLPLSLQTFPSGVMVLRSNNMTEEELLEKIIYLVDAFTKITADQIAKEMSISVFLAGERLDAAASEGHIVLDKSIHGLQYFPNKFVNP